MLFLHIRIVFHGNVESAVPSLTTDPAAAIDGSTENLSDLMNHIKSLKDTVLPAIKPETIPTRNSVTAEIPPAVTPQKNPDISEGNTSAKIVAIPPPELVTPAENIDKPKPKKQAKMRVMAKMKPVQVSDNYLSTFEQHISRGFPINITLDRHMRRLARSRQCKGKPVFVTMARVKSDLYWQLIENFFFTM